MLRINNFSVMSGRSHNQYCRELMCLAQGHNTMTPVGIEPRTSRLGVRRSTTTLPHSLLEYYIIVIGIGDGNPGLAIHSRYAGP